MFLVDTIQNFNRKILYFLIYLFESQALLHMAFSIHTRAKVFQSITCILNCYISSHNLEYFSNNIHKKSCDNQKLLAKNSKPTL